MIKYSIVYNYCPITQRMRFITFALAVLGAITVSAHPTNTCPGPKPNREFGVIAINSGTNVHFQAFTAARRGLSAGLKNQNAQCERPKEQFATFYIEDGALFLYTPESAETQQFFVDRSGMGMYFKPTYSSPSATLTKSLVSRPGHNPIHHRRRRHPPLRRTQGLVHQRPKPPPICRQRPHRMPWCRRLLEHLGCRRAEPRTQRGLPWHCRTCGVY